MHFKVMGGRVGGLAPAATTLTPRSYAYGIKVLPDMECIFKWEVGEFFYLFYRASQFYDLRSFLPFNWKKMKNCVMPDWLILATLL